MSICELLRLSRTDTEITHTVYSMQAQKSTIFPYSLTCKARRATYLIFIVAISFNSSNLIEEYSCKHRELPHPLGAKSWMAPTATLAASRLFSGSWTLTKWHNFPREEALRSDVAPLVKMKDQPPVMRHAWPERSAMHSSMAACDGKGDSGPGVMASVSAIHSSVHVTFGRKADVRHSCQGVPTLTGI